MPAPVAFHPCYTTFNRKSRSSPSGRLEVGVFLQRALDGAGRANKSEYVYQIIKIDVQHTVNVLRFVPKGWPRPPARGDSDAIILSSTGLCAVGEKHHRQEQWRRAICNFLFHRDPCPAQPCPARTCERLSDQPSKRGLQSCLTRTVINQTNIHINII